MTDDSVPRDPPAQSGPVPRSRARRRVLRRRRSPPLRPAVVPAVRTSRRREPIDFRRRRRRRRITHRAPRLARREPLCLVVYVTPTPPPPPDTRQSSTITHDNNINVVCPASVSVTTGHCRTGCVGRVRTSGLPPPPHAVRDRYGTGRMLLLEKS